MALQEKESMMAENSDDSMVEKLRKAIPKIEVPQLSIATLSYPQPSVSLPDVEFEPSPLVTNVEENRASEFHARLSRLINDFNDSLDDAHEVGVTLVTFGPRVVFHLESIGYWDPSLISFAGKTDDGAPVQLVQHVGQISILLTRLPRENPDEPKVKIGFHHGGGSAA